MTSRPGWCGPWRFVDGQWVRPYRPKVVYGNWTQGLWLSQSSSANFTLTLAPTLKHGPRVPA